MVTLSAKLTFYLPDATSLKDKRRVRRSLVDRIKHRFNASVSEVDTQDLHRTLTIGIAVVSGSTDHARQSLDKIIRDIEKNTEVELLSVEKGGASL